ncbi:MAG TPA: YlbE-like family protein [Haloplasmataceae bacterium]
MNRRPLPPIREIYQDDHLLFYLRTHPDWYKILARYPDRYSEFRRVAKEEMKLTAYHRLERFKNQVALLQLLAEYLKGNG